MKVYQKEERMFICLVISPEKQSHKYFIEEFADPSNERQKMIIKTLQEKEKLDSELGKLESKLYRLLGDDRKKSVFDLIRW